MRWTHWHGEGAPTFADRTEAGGALGAMLLHRIPDLPGLAESGDVLVLGLPRGGVVVAAEVADALGAPMDVLVVRKLGVPWQPELAFGAVAAGALVLNPDVAPKVSESDRARVLAEETAELYRRERAFRGDRPPLDLRDKVVVLVDDGLATGATARAAIAAAHHAGARRVILAVPVAAPDSAAAIVAAGDEIVAVATPHTFYAVGQFYDDFTQTSDEEVRALLAAGPG